MQLITKIKQNVWQRRQSLRTRSVPANGVLAEYTGAIAAKRLFVVFLMIAIFMLATLAMTIGPLEITTFEVYSTILHRFLPDYFSLPGELAERTVWYIRLPRLIMGLTAGFSLAVSGAVMQPVLRNPLASPFTLGISAGAGFGAALGILFCKGIGGGAYFVVANAFAFSLLTAFMILGLVGLKGASPGNMVLAGIALSYLFNAGTILMQYFADAWAVTEIVFWLVGSLAKSTWSSLRLMLPVMLCCVPYLLSKTKELNILNAGDEVAESLGVRVRSLRVKLMVAAALLTASTICFTGTIGFIGLVAPHICRLILGGDNRFVVPASGLIGALLLGGADIGAVHLIAPTVLPIGVMTSFMGVPLFICLIMKNRSEYWR